MENRALKLAAGPRHRRRSAPVRSAAIDRRAGTCTGLSDEVIIIEDDYEATAQPLRLLKAKLAMWLSTETLQGHRASRP